MQAVTTIGLDIANSVFSGPRHRRDRQRYCLHRYSERHWRDRPYVRIWHFSEIPSAANDAAYGSKADFCRQRAAPRIGARHH
jgi:hypothetical protein